jgi:serine/threonine-protein kinase
MMARRLSEPPPSVRAVRPSVPAAVDEAIRKALAPVAADRFDGMAPFAAALQGAATGSSAAPAATAVTVPAEKPAAPADATVVPRGRRVPVAATALMLGILIGLGVLFAWRRSGHGEGGTRVLAVLPFENLGDSGDAYFADGVTDEVRTKLAKVSGLDVIARGSSNEYRGTGKRAQEIAQELGAGYLLTGTVRWVKNPDGSSRVRVTPELVEVPPGQTPRTRWGEQFDAGITDVFEVQADIAGKVVRALDVALADSVEAELVARPTESVPAYDAFLKAEAVAFTGGNPELRRAVGWYQEAVRLDPGFAVAWARLGRSAAFLYANAGSSSEVAALARRGIEQARRIAPKHPDTYAARAYVESFIEGRPEPALSIAEEGLRVAPSNSELLAAAAFQEQTLGRFENVVTRLERAFTIDPRAANLSRRLGYAYMVLRRYLDAKTALERALTLSPANLLAQQNLVLVALMQGDVEPVRRIGAAPAGVTSDEMLAYLSQFEELYWGLDDGQQRRVLELGPEMFEGDRAAWALVRAHLHRLRGEPAKARVWADSARAHFETQVRDSPDDPQRLVQHGVALAYLGRRAEAIRDGRRAVELLPPSKDMYFGPYIQHQLVRIYLALGEHEAALDTLEPLLGMPYTLTPAWLRIDPMFDPIRAHPRFARLVNAD